MTELNTRSQDGTAIVVHDLGGQGTPALMIHGVGLNGMMFQPIAEELAEHYHCYAVDLRGQGSSGAPSHLDFAWARLGDDVAAAATAIRSTGTNGRPLAAIAHSAGGAAALLAEARTPGTFGAMYCYEPIVRSPKMQEKVTKHHPIGSRSRTLGSRGRHHLSGHRCLWRSRRQRTWEDIRGNCCLAYRSFAINQICRTRPLWSV